MTLRHRAEAELRAHYRNRAKQAPLKMLVHRPGHLRADSMGYIWVELGPGRKSWEGLTSDGEAILLARHERKTALRLLLDVLAGRARV